MAKGLLLIDIQNDYFPGGAMELVGMEQAAAQAASLLASFRESAGPVYHVQHFSVRPGAGFFLPGTEGAEVHTSVAPAQGESLTQKNFPNAFRETELESVLRRDGIEELTICGAMSHMCVDATTRAAFDLGLACRVASDACATRDLEFEGRSLASADVHAAFMSALAAPYATVAPSRDLISG